VSSPNLGIPLLTATQSSKYVTVNDAIEALDGKVAGFDSIAMSDADNTPSNTVATQNATLKFTGTLTANRNVILPQSAGLYVIHNATTGGFSLTVKTAAAGSPATVSVANASVELVYCDGSNINAVN
jgi:hypothetical protein